MAMRTQAFGPLRVTQANRAKRRALASRKRQKGLTLIESAAALGIVALMLVSFGRLTAENQGATKSRATAIQASQITAAAGQYIQANFSRVLAATGSDGNTTVVVPVARAPGSSTDPSWGTAIPTGGNLESLQKQGFLSQSFTDRNPYGQQTVLVITQPSATDPATGAVTKTGRLEAMVLTYGGQSIPDAELGRIATSIGASGGFVPTNPPSGITQGTITGAYGGWRTAASSWANPVSGAPEAGHIASTLAFQSGVGESDYLNRNWTGDPKDNTMNTAILMNGNDLRGAGDVSSNTVHAGASVSTPTITAANGGPMVVDMNNQSVVGIKTIQGVMDATGLGQIDMTNQNVTVTQLSGTPNAAGDPNTTLRLAATDVTASGTFSAGKDAVVGGDLTVGTNVDSSGNMIGGDVIVPKGRVVASKFVDADAKNYSIDPNGLTGLGTFDPSLINADTLIYGSSVNRPTAMQNPKTIDCTGKSDVECDAAIQAMTDVYLQDVNKYDPNTAAGKAAIAAGTALPPMRLGDLLPSMVARGVYVVGSDGLVTDGQPDAAAPNQPHLISWTDSSGAPVAVPGRTILMPACGTGRPEIYMSKLDDSYSFDFNDSANGGANPALLVQRTLGGSATGTGGTYQGDGVYSQGWTTVAGTFQPVQTITTQPVVQDVKIAGVNAASTVSINQTTVGSLPAWEVFVSDEGERKLGVNGSTKSVVRRVLAQTFCNYNSVRGFYGASSSVQAPTPTP